MKENIIILSMLFIFYSCQDEAYKIKIENIGEIKETIIKTEQLIKKIEVLNNKYYPIFIFEDNGITMVFTSINYDNTSLNKKEKNFANVQKCIDTCNIIPGLTIEECTKLKTELKKLRKWGIKANDVELNEGTLLFFYYDYVDLPDMEARDIGYLALLSEEIVNTKDFKQRFIVMDEKDGIYMIKRNW